MHEFSIWGRRAACLTGLLLALAAPARSALNNSTVVNVFTAHPIHFSDASRYNTAGVSGEEGGCIIRRDVELPAWSGPVQITARVVVYSTLLEGGDGDPWDRAGSVLLDIPGMAPIELLKFITGFGGRSDLRQDVSDLAPLLSGKRSLRAFDDTWVSPAWKLSFELICRPVTAPANPDWADGIFYNTGMTATQVGPEKPVVAVNIPPTTSQVTLTWYASGHCTDGTDAGGTGYWQISSFITGLGDISSWCASRIVLNGEEKKLLPIRTSTPLRIDLVDDSRLPVFAAAACIQVASALILLAGEPSEYAPSPWSAETRIQREIQ